MIENLKFYCDKEVSLKDAADVNGLVTSASPDETLDRCMDDLFVPYTEGDRYLKKEIESLHKLFGNIVSDFLSAMVSYVYYMASSFINISDNSNIER